MPTPLESLMACLRRITPWIGPVEDGAMFVADLVAAAAAHPATCHHRGGAATTDALTRAAAMLRAGGDAVLIARAVEQLELALELADAARERTIAARVADYGGGTQDAAALTDLHIAVATAHPGDETAAWAAWQDGLTAARGRGEEWAHEKHFA